MSEWQPIDTAPKDGTQILAYQNPSQGLPGDMKVIEFFLDCWVDPMSLEPCYPDYWMPLPEPPEGEQVCQ